MEQRHPGLTKAIAEFLSEAARVCLDRHHASPVDVTLERVESQSVAAISWQTTDSITQGAWANEIDTTEQGAYGCALAAIELVDGLVAVRRAETMTGADYYIAPAGTFAEDLEDCVRLEVSGVDQGDRTVIAQRLRTKVKQAAAGASNLPARAAVVGFKQLLILQSEDQP